MKLSPARRTLFVALPLGILIGAAAAYAANPKLDEADAHVDRAIGALHAAYNPKEKGEFGGHRKRAIELLEDTKRAIKKAKEYDDKHPPKDPKPDPGPKPDGGGPKPDPGPKPDGGGPKPDPGPKPTVGPKPDPAPKPTTGPKPTPAPKL
jgi:outer membrane biosynthesis protein TonB